MNISVCKLIDYLPFALLIEKDQEILFFNTRLLNLLGIPIDQQVSSDILSKIEDKLKSVRVKQREGKK